MMRATTLLLLLAGAALGAASPALATSFEASPVNVEIHAPGATSKVTIKNSGDKPLNTQIRVFRWSQSNGTETLEPTTDVVASPPMVTVDAKSEQLIRLVRVDKRPVAAEETYRIFIDEIPEPGLRKSGQVGIALRYSIPVFVMPQAGGEAQIAWSVEHSGGQAFLTASNTGDRRLKVSDLKLKDASGKLLSLGEGLNGYVLARSTKRWVIPAKAQKLGLSGPVVISARGDDGPFNAQAQASADH